MKWLVLSVMSLHQYKAAATPHRMKIKRTNQCCWCCAADHPDCCGVVVVVQCCVRVQAGMRCWSHGPRPSRNSGHTASRNSRCWYLHWVTGDHVWPAPGDTGHLVTVCGPSRCCPPLTILLHSGELQLLCCCCWGNFQRGRDDHRYPSPLWSVLFTLVTEVTADTGIRHQYPRMECWPAHLQVSL